MDWTSPEQTIYLRVPLSTSAAPHGDPQPLQPEDPFIEYEYPLARRTIPYPPLDLVEYLSPVKLHLPGHLVSQQPTLSGAQLRGSSSQRYGRNLSVFALRL